MNGSLAAVLTGGYGPLSWQAHAKSIAAERFRLAQGRWPHSLHELTPLWLKREPTDPFDNRPLRLRQDPQGLVVFSVGPDGKDNGGDFQTLNTHQHNTDLGVRLWNVAQRRQPPANP